ncbi:hypothetical protein GCM10023328_48120 [Modestobacter marinus]|uniref:Secreted protein n=1 Tax=Modestobacter marinus TaxID=477641 RepID=A0ABQ2GBB9_9ACTN|nr:hypothetical protein [Modestobacter marinus]GGL83849.1 hypothetical protein GCM10011589_45300 [Modestobacter marinus]
MIVWLSIAVVGFVILAALVVVLAQSSTARYEFERNQVQRDQLDRLPAEWDHDFADDEELVTLVVEVASALVESGLSLHDCVGEETAGGVCLSPEPGRPGIVVSWHQHYRASSEDVRSVEVHGAVQAEMNLALAECLLQLGFDVEPFGDSGCSLVVIGTR